MSWHYAERTENDILISVKINDDSHATICTVYGSTSPMNDQYVGASKLTENVNMICATKEMLDALRKIQFRCECFLEDDRDMKKHSIEAIKAICDSAIDKAIVQ